MMHAEILPAEQAACLTALGPAATALGFYLAGGTAIALHLGHRRSIDFDWFTPHFPGHPAELAEALRGHGVTFTPSTLAERTAHGSVDGVRVSFLEFRLPLLEPLVDWAEGGSRLASCPDLAAMKLLAVAQRGTKKDFIDLHALSRRLSLPRMLESYRQRFCVSDTSRVLAGLCYFDDAENEPPPVMLVPYDWETVKNDLRDMVRHIA